MKSPIKTFTLLFLALSAGGLFILIGGRLPASSAEIPVDTTPSKVKVRPLQPSDIDIHTLWTLTNQERAKAGAPAVSLNPKLNQSATEKCNDMVARDYWNHNTPDGQDPWPVILKHTKYKHAGENLAFQYENANDIVIGWMGSPTHKANLVDPRFDNVGFAVCVSENLAGQGRGLIVVQHFIND